MKAGHIGILKKKIYHRTTYVECMETENVATNNTDFLNTNIKHEKKWNVFYMFLCKLDFFVFLICY